MASDGLILAGDIGGTKTVVALFERAGEEVRALREATYPSQGHGSLEAILSAFLATGPRPALAAGCFGVAGPIIDGECKTTNLPWHLSEKALTGALGGTRVKLLNDLEAAAFGMLHLGPDELATLQPCPTPARKGNIAVVAAGTGLGEAILYWDGQQHHPIACEGGHTDFGPRNDLEVDLLRYLRQRHGGHVSYERVLSGPGFFSLYRFLRDTGVHPEPPWMAERLREAEDPNAVITDVGLARQADIAVRTLDVFAEIYGAEAGNLALKCLALGGVFVGGGIAPKILPALQSGLFLRGMLDKGRFGELLKQLPVHVALNPRAPLLGAAHFARRLVG